MERYLNENFNVKPKSSCDAKGKISSDALQRWKKLSGIVKNPKRRFRFTANLSKRNEAETIKRNNRYVVPDVNDGVSADEVPSSTCPMFEQTSFVRSAFGLVLAISYIWNLLSSYLKTTSFVRSIFHYLVLAVSCAGDLSGYFVLKATSFAQDLSTYLVLEATALVSRLFGYLLLARSFVRDIFSFAVLRASSSTWILCSYLVLKATLFLRSLFCYLVLAVSFAGDLCGYFALKATSFARVLSTYLVLEATSLVSRLFGYLVLARSLVRDIFSFAVLQASSSAWILCSYLVLKATLFVRSIFRYIVLAASFAGDLFSYFVLKATSFARVLSTYLVLEATALVSRLFGYLVFARSFVRDIFSFAVLWPLSSAWILCNYLVLEATTFARRIFGYLVLTTSSFVRDLYSHLVVEATVFVQAIFSYVVFKVTFLWGLFRDLVLEAILFVVKIVREHTWGFLGIALAVYPSIMGRTVVETRQQGQRQQNGLADIFCCVVKLIISFIHFCLTNLVFRENYSTSVCVVLFAITVGMFIFKRRENLADSFRNTYVTSSGDLSISPNIVQRWTMVYLLTRLTNLSMNSSLTSPSTSTRPSNIPMNSGLTSLTTAVIHQAAMLFEVHHPLCKYIKHALVLFCLFLEAVSSAFDQFAKNRPHFLLVGVLLSALSFALTIIPAFVKRRTIATTIVRAQEQVIGRLEILFASLQLLVSVIDFILVKLDVKVNYSTASIYTLAFAIYLVGFVFKTDGCVTNSTRHSSHISSGDSPVNSLSGYVSSTPNVPFLTEIIVDRFDPLSDLSTISSLSSIMQAATSPVNRQYQLQIIEAYVRETAVRMFTSYYNPFSEIEDRSNIGRELGRRRRNQMLLYGNSDNDELINILIHGDSS